MLVDIFSTFDDANSSFLSIYSTSWLLTFAFLFVLGSNYWLANNRLRQFINILKSVISAQLMRSIGVNLGGFFVIISSLFLLLIGINMVGLVPYTFSVSSHLAFSFVVGLPMWFSLVISGITYNSGHAIAGLLPTGAPAVLNPFLVLVETVSLCVRPITLSVRLVANMSAGHIILGLIGSFLGASFFSSSSFGMLSLVLVECFYFMFEIGVGLIQAYIFVLLLTLYADEHAV